MNKIWKSIDALYNISSLKVKNINRKKKRACLDR